MPVLQPMKGLALFLIIILAGCKSEPENVPGIGEAFVGPATLAIRQDINPQSPVVATLKHGEHLDILQRRRRFVKVRTARQVEGWTEDRQLLSAEELANLRKLSEHAKSAPSQGLATTYGVLNVHTEPDRQSPSFLQVKEGDKVDVIGRRVAPRSAPPPPKPPPPPPAAKKRSKKQSKEGKKQIP